MTHIKCLLHLALLGFCTGVSAQAFPSKAVRMVVAWPPGGGADALARLMAPKLAETWKQQVFVENRPGASGHIGADHVAQSPADGLTLLMSSTASLTEKNVSQFAPVTLVSASPYVVTANPKVKATNVRELIAAGGNVYYLAKFAGIFGLNVQDIGAQQEAREAWAQLARERPDLPELTALAR